MELSLESRKFRRVKNPVGQIFLSLWAGFVCVSALRGYTNDFTELPLVYWGDSAVGVFGIFFVIFWFYLVLSFVLMGLHGLHTVHVSREGVRLVLLTDTAEERQNSFTQMMKVALDVAVAMENK